ncbi:MAG: bifunctional metallophosphatase/5'-nucleotidase [Lentisphaerales bacterium]|nr:bifunctional metallophosphatase/5'-nucleotidase [Lentisphaerales bacterium]
MGKITLVYTTDVHGYVTGDSYFNNRGSNHGIAHVATKLKEIREQEEEVVYFDNGDLISGSLLSIRCAEDLRLSAPIVSALDSLNCRFSVIGNHEFDYGRKYLDKVIEQSQFPWLAANIFKNSSKKAAFGSGHYMHETQCGKKIAFIGLTTEETATLAYKELIKDLKIVSPLEVLPDKIAEVKELGADFIAVCYHGGYESGLCYWQNDEDIGPLTSEIADNFPEIDLLITGHTHGCTANRTVNGVHTIQAGCNGLFIGKIDIDFDQSTPKITSEVISVKECKLDDEVMEVTAKAHESTFAWLTEVVAKSKDSYIPEKPLDPLIKPSRMMSLIHDVLRDHSECDITVASFWDMSGWGKGPVKRKKILNLLPDNYLHILNITGQNIRLALERTAEFFTLAEDGRCLVSTKTYEYDIWSGIQYKIDISRPVGERVIELSHNGQPLQDKDRFKVAFYHFRAGGALGYDMLKQHRPTWKSAKSVRDHLFKYLLTNDRLKVPVENNFLITNKDQIIEEAFSQ